MSDINKQKHQRTYTVLYEKGPTGWGAYIPDLPGCVTAGKTRLEVEQGIREALELHIEGMAEDGDVIPEPTVFPGQITVSIPVPALRKTA